MKIYSKFVSFQTIFFLHCISKLHSANVPQCGWTAGQVLSFHRTCCLRQNEREWIRCRYRVLFKNTLLHGSRVDPHCSFMTFTDCQPVLDSSVCLQGVSLYSRVEPLTFNWSNKDRRWMCGFKRRKNAGIKLVELRQMIDEGGWLRQMNVFDTTMRRTLSGIWQTFSFNPRIWIYHQGKHCYFCAVLTVLKEDKQKQRAPK